MISRVLRFLASPAGRALIALGLVLLLGLVFHADGAFYKFGTHRDAIRQASVCGILACGMTLVIITAGIDLAVGSILGLTGVCFALITIHWGWPAWQAIPAALAVGAACGAVAGILTAGAGIQPFIATLAMMSIARGATLVISQGSPMATAPTVNWLGRTVGGIPIPIVMMVIAGFVCWFILSRTVLGRSMYAIGGNVEAARLSGLPVKKILVTVYALSGLFAGLAGLVMAGRLSSAQPQAGVGYELDAIAAVVIGGASLAGGTGKATGTLIGAILLAVIRNGLNLLNVSSFWQQIVIGLVIALAVGFDVLRKKTTT